MSETTKLDPRDLVMRYVARHNISDGSGSGVSYWGSFHKCPLCYYLDKGTPQEREMAADGEEVRVSVGYYAGVGICFHKIHELRDLGLLDSTEFAFAGNQEPPEWIEALRLWRAYTKEFPNPEWEIVATEWPFEFKDEESFREFGVPKYTGLLDLVVRVHPHQLEGLRGPPRGLPLVSPGLYMVDHKVKWQREANAKEQWEYRMQFKAYMRAWNLRHPEPENQILGTITNVVYAYKQQKRDPTKGGPKFESFFIQAVTPAQMVIVRRYLELGWQLRETYGLRANTEECFRFKGRTCQHHPSQGGVCDLIGEIK